MKVNWKLLRQVLGHEGFSFYLVSLHNYRLNRHPARVLTVDTSRHVMCIWF